MKKRLLGILCAACLIAALLPAQVQAAEGDGIISDFGELQAAFNSGGEYTLAKDIIVDAGLTLESGKTLTINGGGHVISPAVTGLNEQGLVNSNATEITMITNEGTLTMNDLAVYGGRGRIIFNNEKGSLTMQRTSLERAYSSSGGAGLYNNDYAKVLMINSSIRRNCCLSPGGGFFNYGTMIMENCSLVENRNFANGGGGGAGENKSGGKLYMNNCTVANNQSSEIGGGINNSFGADLYIMNSTFTGNVTTHYSGGGGIGNNRNQNTNSCVYAVNSVFSFNYQGSGVSDIGYATNEGVTLINCAYGNVGSSASANSLSLETLTTTEVFNGARVSGSVNENGVEDTNKVYNRPLIMSIDKYTYGVYPGVSSVLLSGGVDALPAMKYQKVYGISQRKKFADDIR